MIKKLCHIALGLLILALPLLSCVSVSASSNPNFYAIGLDYKAYDELATLTGKIATVHFESDKGGIGGIEQDIRIKTEEGDLLVEITNWYYGGYAGLTYGVGIVVYKDNQYWFGKRVSSQMGETYKYKVTIDNGIVYATIWDSQGQIMVHKDFGDNAQYIEHTASYIEYWRYDEPGSFFYYGYVTIDNTEQLQYRDDFYHKAKGLPFGFFLIHRNWGGITDKGEIDDR